MLSDSAFLCHSLIHRERNRELILNDERMIADERRALNWTRSAWRAMLTTSIQTSEIVGHELEVPMRRKYLLDGGVIKDPKAQP